MKRIRGRNGIYKWEGPRPENPGDELDPTRSRLAPCGTLSSYNRHLRWGEKPCDECTDAMRRYHKRRRVSTRTIPLKPCGTNAAYNRHLKNNETPCEECREAAVQHMRNRRQAKRKRAA